MFSMPEMPMMPPVDLKENYLKFLRHEKTPMIPNYLVSNAGLGAGAVADPWFECGPVAGGYDGFGVLWDAPVSGGGAPMPRPNMFVLDDITQWREKVKFPNVEEFNWEEKAKQDLAGVDRSKQLVDYGIAHGVFDRLTILMGFEEGLMAMLTDPEEVNDFFTAVTDYKIKHLDYVAKYYQPDTVTYADDMATERDLFISPETYRKLIKPHHKRFCDACYERGILPVLHCCGKAEAIVEDMIDCGFVAWNNVQPSNDICRIIEQYGERIGLIGGYDSNGKPARVDVTQEEVDTEIHRCLDTYGKYGYGYAFFGFRYVNSLDFELFMRNMGAIIEESMKYSFELMAKNMGQQ